MYHMCRNLVCEVMQHSMNVLKFNIIYIEFGYLLTPFTVGATVNCISAQECREILCNSIDTFEEVFCKQHSSIDFAIECVLSAIISHFHSIPKIEFLKYSSDHHRFPQKTTHDFSQFGRNTDSEKMYKIYRS